MTTYGGIAIALAWPDYIGKQTGTWYDTPMRWMGINKNYHYKVGHAGLVLVNRETGKCNYFDCGRFHAPFQYGRIRDATTDTDLTVHTKAEISVHEIANLEEILQEIQQNQSFHGEGTLFASYCPVNFKAVWSKAREMQSQGAIPFGPFILEGTNCCRFVRTSILAGTPARKYELMLRYLWPFKPMPFTIFKSLPNKRIIRAIKAPVHRDSEKIRSLYNRDTVNFTLPEPARPENIPEGSQWLAGEVAGSWFNLHAADNKYIISRYSAAGLLECSGSFMQKSGGEFNSTEAFRFTYMSHCRKVTISQHGHLFEFYREA